MGEAKRRKLILGDLYGKPAVSTSIQHEPEYDTLSTSWLFGYWCNSWSDPNPEQYWFDYTNLDYCAMHLDDAIEMAIEKGYLDASKRTEVKAYCLETGEYMEGSEESKGWMIEVDKDWSPTFEPNESNWIAIEEVNYFDLIDTNIYTDTNIYHSPMDRKIVDIHRQKGMFVRDNLTLEQAMKLAGFNPADKMSTKYQRAYLKCLCDNYGFAFYKKIKGEIQKITICTQRTEKEQAHHESFIQMTDDEFFEFLESLAPVKV